MTSALVRDAGELWEQATRSPFLDAAAAGTLPPDVFRRWLAQDYLFATGLLSAQAYMLAKAPRDCHGPLTGGLAALDAELAWFEKHAARLELRLDVLPHPVCRAYVDFLTRDALSQRFPVLLAVLYGVEASYLAAWSALAPAGPYAEFIERWSSPAFIAYVESLAALAARYPHEAQQAHFNAVLAHERDFWNMCWEG